MTAVPDPNQTFQQYIQQLLATAPTNTGFSSAFTGAGQQATQPQQQAPQTPTTNITSGLFSQYLGGGGDGGGDNGFSSPSSTGPGQGISTAAQDVGFAMMGNPSAIASGINQGLGLLGIQNPIAPLMSLAVKGIGTGIINNQIDAISNSFGAMSDIGAIGLGGVGSISDANGNISSISNQAMVDAYDMGMFGTTGAGLAGGTSAMGPTGGISEGFDGSPSAPSAGVGAQEGFDGSPGDGGGGGGGSKIICTAMNQSYGFGSFRQAIWLRYSADHMTKEHEVGYHTLFLPLVDAAYKQDKWYSKPLRKILEHGARHRTSDLRAEMRGTKRDVLGRIYRTIFEPLCYVVGKIKTL